MRPSRDAPIPACARPADPPAPAWCLGPSFASTQPASPSRARLAPPLAPAARPPARLPASLPPAPNQPRPPRPERRQPCAAAAAPQQPPAGRWIPALGGSPVGEGGGAAVAGKRGGGAVGPGRARPAARGAREAAGPAPGSRMPSRRCCCCWKTHVRGCCSCECRHRCQGWMGVLCA